MKISSRIKEIEREINKADKRSYLGKYSDANILEAKLQILKEWEQREKEIEEIIDNFDTEKYIGEYCFKASSFRKELKSKLKGEGK